MLKTKDKQRIKVKKSTFAVTNDQFVDISYQTLNY